MPLIEVGYDQATGEVVYQALSHQREEGKVYTEHVIRGAAFVRDREVHAVPECPGPGYVWRWAPVFEWEFQQANADQARDQARASALEVVDAEAGLARLRYITSVPGQAETYTRKEQQAREWAAAGFEGPAPSFISAEAIALGRAPQLVAEEVIELADLWANVTGPSIEATRRKWKVLIGGASTIAAIEAAKAAAVSELAAL